MGPCFALQVRSQSIQAAWPASCALRAEVAVPQFQLANISGIFHRLVLIKETQRFGSCQCFRREAKNYEADFIGSCLSLSAEERQKAFSICHQEHISVPLPTSTYLSAALTDGNAAFAERCRVCGWRYSTHVV